jgi:germination protein M
MLGRRRHLGLPGVVPVGLVMMAAVATSCARPAEQPPRATPSPSDSPTPTAAPETSTVTVYYLIDFAGRMWLAPERHEVPEQARIGRAALEELIEGRPQDSDHVTPIPADARILDLTIEEGLATVDWNADVLEADVGSEGESLGIQSIVWTLTEFPTVDRVRFTVEGKDQGTASNDRTIEDWWGHVGLDDQPFRRTEAIEVLEPITIWTPTEGATVGPTFVVEGEASTFEANVPIRILDAGGALVQTEVTTATEGGPGRGTFQMEITIQAPPTSPERWRLEAFEENQETGEEFFVQSREIRVGVEPG